MPRAPILRVAVPSPLRTLFDYLPPSADLRAIVPGMRVRVPFGRATVTGVVAEVTTETVVAPPRLKRAMAVLDDAPLLAPSMRKLLSWAAAYYHHAPGEVWFSAFPAALRGGAAPRSTQAMRWRLTAAGAEREASAMARAPRQAELLELLRRHPQGLESATLNAFGAQAAPTLRRMQARGWVECVAAAPDAAIAVSVTEVAPVLNRPQENAVTAISAAFGTFAPFLLEGVTGSGKTEVYLRVAERVLARGEQVLVLVPEIGLTPQIVTRIQRRFAAPIALLHSGLGDAERARNWEAARQGRAAIVIGTRSAVFASLSRPGAIIVDEEHDASFKQHEGFRYSARDVAVMRAHLERVPVVLGSATPSLECLHNVREERYRHLELPARAGAALPPAVRVVDVRRQPMLGPLSKTLRDAVSAHLKDGGQVLLFLNRRGYAPTLLCHACGWIARCARCDAHLTLHQSDGRLRCHHCGSERPIDAHCPACRGGELRAVGAGTERIEQVLAELFPGVGIARVDRDSTRRKGALDALFDGIHRGDYRVLIGTQMLAKGHHFPGVTLVGVLNTDQGLFSTDFRASERMAQLIVQVAGRAGRGDRPGEVLIQTHFPDHPLLRVLLHDGYRAFADAVLAERKATQLPPYAYLALLRAEATGREQPQAFLAEAAALATVPRGVRLLGPVAAPMEKRAGRFRAQLLVQCEQRAPLHRFLDAWLPAIETLKSARRVRWSLDVDPQETF
jgi:primosomal protein N' (replication factor Y)